MVLSALDEMAASHSESASQAEGLSLNTALQNKIQTMEGMLSAISLVQDSLKFKRNTEHFEAVFKEAEDRCGNLSLGPIVPPRTHRPPKRYSGQVPAYTPGSAVDFRRVEFYSRCTIY